MVKKNLPTKAVAPKGAPKSFPLNAVIRLTKLGAVNPKRPNTGAHVLYALYGKGGLTVGAYLNKVAAQKVRSHAGRLALSWDFARGFITVGK